MSASGEPLASRFYNHDPNPLEETYLDLSKHLQACEAQFRISSMFELLPERLLKALAMTCVSAKVGLGLSSGYLYSPLCYEGPLRPERLCLYTDSSSSVYQNGLP